MSEEIIGKITHYFSKVGVAVLAFEKGKLKAGDVIHISGHTTDLTMSITSMEIDNQKVDEVKQEDSFGIKVEENVREHDVVFKVTEE